MAVRPAQGQHTKPFIVGPRGVILETSEQFYSFAPIPLKHGIVHNEDGGSRDGSQSFDTLHRVTAERSQEAPPSEATMIEKPIDSIFARKGFTFGTFEQTKPVFLMKKQDKNEHEQMGTGIAKRLFESCFSQVLQDTEFLKSRSHFRWELI
jgi:hypothetical protein